MKLGFEDAIILEKGVPGKIVNKGTFLKNTFLVIHSAWQYTYLLNFSQDIEQLSQQKCKCVIDDAFDEFVANLLNSSDYNYCEVVCNKLLYKKQYVVA